MSVDGELRTTQVDLAGLMHVMGKNLYSTPEVALRELVQNAHDSCTRRQIEAGDDFEPLIEVKCDPVKHTLTIIDRGAGLTHDEVVEYLATVGRGYTGKLRREGHEDDGLIGAFGLGFLSAYFVSDRVIVHTTSFQEPDKGWRFSSRGGERYQLSAAPARPVGTSVELELSPKFHALGDPHVTLRLLRKYCCLLNFPIKADGAAEPVNRPLPPWRLDDEPPVRVRRLRMDFAQRFEPSFEPLCVLPLVEDGPARGLLWIQSGMTYGTSDNRHVAVFVRGMMVSDDARRLLPTWAGFCGLVVEADTLTPTASREALQEDEDWHAVAAQVEESLITGLADLSRNDPAAWRVVTRRHNEALLGASLCDDRLFELLAKVLTVPTSQGDLPLDAIRKRSGGKIHVSAGDAAGYESMLFRALQVPLVVGTRYGALPFCLRDADRSGAPVVEVGTKKANSQLFAEVSLQAEQSARLSALFGGARREVVPTRFAPKSLPLVLAPDREAKLKASLEADDADRRITSALLGLARRYTEKIDGTVDSRLYVNLDSPLVQGVMAGSTPRHDAVAAIMLSFAELFAAGDPAADCDAGKAFDTLTDRLTELMA